MPQKGKQIEDISGGKIILYQNNLEVKLLQDTVWLTQKQMSELFETERSVITKHLRNILKTKELEEKSVCANFAHTARDGKTYHTNYYSLDMIISVGYRVNSKRGTQFRIWATNVLRKHLVDGYSINQKRLETQAGKVKELQDAVSLLSNVVLLENISDETKGVISIISEYSRGLSLLDDYDHERLSTPGGTRRKTAVMTYEEAQEIIAAYSSKDEICPCTMFM